MEIIVKEKIIFSFIRTGVIYKNLIQIFFCAILFLFFLTFSTACSQNDIWSEADKSLRNIDYSITINGEAAEEGDIDFKEVIAGKQVSFTVTITNNDSKILEISSLDLNDASNFDVIRDNQTGSFSISPNTTYTFQLVYHPQDENAHTADFSIRAKNSSSMDFVLKGTGAEQIIYVSTSGDDISGRGTRSSPYASPGKACEEANDNFEIRVAGGSYSVSKTIVVKNKGLIITGSYSDDGNWILEADAITTNIYGNFQTNADSTVIRFEHDFDVDNIVEFEKFNIYTAENSNAHAVGMEFTNGVSIISGTTIRGRTGNKSMTIVKGSGNESRTVLVFSFCSLFASDPDNINDSSSENSYGLYLSENIRALAISCFIFGGNSLNGNVYAVYTADSVNHVPEAELLSNLVLSGISQGSTGESYGVYLKKSSMSYIINNTILSQYAAVKTSGIYLVESSPHIINNLLSSQTGVANATGLYSQDAYLHNLMNNFFDNTTLLNDFVFYQQSPDLTYVFSEAEIQANTTATAPVINNWSGNIVNDPQFISNSLLRIPAGSPAQFGGLDIAAQGLAGIIPSYLGEDYGISTPLYHILVNNTMFDAEYTIRTGNGTSGYSMGAYEVD